MNFSAQASSFHDCATETSWMIEALNMGNIGLWSIFLDPTTGHGEMLANEGMLRLLGLEAQADPAACYEHWFSRIALDAVSSVLQCVEEMISSGQQKEVEYPWQHPWHGTIQVRCGGKVCSSPQGDSRICLRGYHQNINELHAARQSLQESVERVQVMFDSMPIGANFWNKELQNIDCNLAVAKLFDLNSKQEYLERFFQLSPPVQPCGTPSGEKAKEYILRAFEEGCIRFEWMHQKLNGERIPAEITLVRLQHKDQTSVVGYTHDLRESKAMSAEIQRKELDLRNALEAAEKASQAKSIFLSTMTHEIRTPMNAILGFAHIFDRSNLSETQKEQLAKIQVSCGVLLNIINDVLDISKIEAGKLELEQAPFHVHQLLDTVCNIVGFAAFEKGIDLRVNVAPEVPERLVGDSKRISQILLNLLNNAVKFTNEGHVALHVGLRTPANAKAARGETPAEAMLDIRVSDTGIGMTAEQIERLFNPFTQADGSITRRFGGAGLGLAICKRLVDLMGGEIGVVSELGKGAVFMLALHLMPCTENTQAAAPFVSAAEVAVLKAEESTILRSLAGKEVLVVEDNEINQEIAKALLEEYKLVVEIAANGQIALDMAASKRYACIFMDMQMPVMDGLQATQHLRLMGQKAGEDSTDAPIVSALNSTPIIAMTANAMFEDRQRCLDAGMDDYISKPIEPEALRAVLLRWLKK